MSVSKLQAAGHHPKQKAFRLHLKHWGSRLQKEQVALAETGVSTSEKQPKVWAKIVPMARPDVTHLLNCNQHKSLNSSAWTVLGLESRVSVITRCPSQAIFCSEKPDLWQLTHCLACSHTRGSGHTPQCWIIALWLCDFPQLSAKGKPSLAALLFHLRVAGGRSVADTAAARHWTASNVAGDDGSPQKCI